MRKSNNTAKLSFSFVPIFLLIVSLLPPETVALSPGNEVFISNDGRRSSDSEGFHSFAMNYGQITDPEIIYYTSGPSIDIGFTRDHVVCSLRSDNDRFVYHMEFKDCRDVTPEGSKPLHHTTNYFHGNDPSGWITGVKHFGEIVYRDLYPFIDLRYYIEEGNLKYDFIVRPGGDTDDIRLDFQGVRPRLGNERVMIQTPLGSVLEDRPVSFTEDGRPVASAWRIDHDDTVSFSIEDHDTSETLIIDPFVYFSTLIGGNDYEDNPTIKVDGEGYVYMTGYTSSADFPTSLGCYDNYASSSEAFISKFDKKGDRLVFSTYIGGSGGETCNDLMIDDQGAIYISGRTSSSEFPVTEGVYQSSKLGYYDSFILKMNSTGDELVHSTYFGGADVWEDEQDGGCYIDMDSDGNLAVSGWTRNPYFPFTEGAYSTKVTGLNDFYVMRMNSSFDKVFFCTAVGGSGNDYPRFIKAMDDGKIIAGGYTYSTDFPTTSGAYDTSFNGGTDTVVVIVNKTGEKLEGSTYFGGNGNDHGYGFDVTPGGDILITGDTVSTNFPTSSNAYDTTVGGRDTFITVINATLARMIYSTLLGGIEVETGWGIQHFMGDEILSVGYTESPGFPVRASWLNTTNSGGIDGYLVKFNISNGSLVMSSLIGGTSGDAIFDLDMDHDQRFLALAGTTGSVDFPVTKNNVDDTLTSPQRGDFFVTKLLLNDPISAPGNLSVASGDRYINVTWEPPEAYMGDPVETYSFHMGRASDNLTLLYQLPPGQHHINLTGLDNGVTYYFSIAGNTWFCEGPSTKIVFAVPSTTPDAPRNISLSSGDAFVKIEWDPPSIDGGADITGYDIWRMMEGNDPEMVRTVPEDSDSFRDVSLHNGKNYTYWVTARNFRGDGTSSENVTTLVGDVPTGPLNVSVSPHSPEVIRVTWEPPAKDRNLTVFGYKVYRANGTGSMGLVAKVKGLEYRDENLDIGQTYDYSISAVNIKGEGPRSETNSSLAIVLPGIVSAISVKELNAMVTLKWEYPAFDGGGPIQHYNILRGSDRSDLEVINTTTDLTYTDTGLVNGRLYCYSVEPINELGPGTDPLILEAVPFTAPDAPSDPEYERGDRMITLSWGTPSFDGGREVKGYQVSYRNLEEDRTYTLLVGPNATTAITDLIEGGHYEVYVKAINERGFGEPTEPIELEAITYPSEPEDLFEISSDDGTAAFSWADPETDGGSDITGYNIYRDERLIFSAGPDTSEFKDEDLINGVSYEYRLEAVNELGPGSRSVPLAIIPLSLPGTPREVALAQTGDGLRISWMRPDYNGGSAIVSYNIYRGTTDGSAELLKSVPDLQYVDADIDPMTEYRYHVTAENARGEGSGSELVSGSFLLIPGPARNLSMRISGVDVIITWDTPVSDGGDNITGYRIYRQGVDGNEIFIGEVNGEMYQFTDLSAFAGGEYVYTVVPVNSVGEGERSSSTSVKIQEKVNTRSMAVPTIIIGLICMVLVGIAVFLLIRMRGKREENASEERINEEEEPPHVETSNTAAVQTPHPDTGAPTPPGPQNPAQGPAPVIPPPQQMVNEPARPDRTPPQPTAPVQPLANQGVNK